MLPSTKLNKTRSRGTRNLCLEGNCKIWVLNSTKTSLRLRVYCQSQTTRQSGTWSLCPRKQRSGREQTRDFLLEVRKYRTFGFTSAHAPVLPSLRSKEVRTEEPDCNLSFMYRLILICYVFHNRRNKIDSWREHKNFVMASTERYPRPSEDSSVCWTRRNEWIAAGRLPWCSYDLYSLLWRPV